MSIRRLIDEARPDDLWREGIEPESVREQEFKSLQQLKAEDTLAAAKLLFDLRSASAFLPEIWSEWDTLTSLMGKPEDLGTYARGRPWWGAFREVRERERFFHWELEFPEVLLDRETTGFDAVLSNPPWDKVLPARREFYARYDILIRAFTGSELDRRINELEGLHPGLGGRFEEYRSRMTTLAGLLRHSGDFPYSRARTGAAHDDLSKYFIDRAATVTRKGGAVGMVVPSVTYNGDGCVGLREFLLEHTTIERFYAFENRMKIFPIHSGYKFVNMVFRKQEAQAGRFRAAFMRHDLAELARTGDYAEPRRQPATGATAPWMITLDKEEIRRLSPGTYAFLEYRVPADQLIVHKMHDDRPSLASGGSAAWGARLITDLAHEHVYNSTRDKDLFSDPRSGRPYSPDWVLPRPYSDPVETMDRMRDRGLWPVFEGKHIEQFLVGIRPIRWWLSVNQAEQKYGKSPRSEETLVFRATASNTNERTFIAAVLPPRSAASHSLSAVILTQPPADVAATVLNSLAFDFGLRMRTAGTNIGFTYVLRMPVPTVHSLQVVTSVSTRHAWGGGMHHITEDPDTWPHLWSGNRAVAEAYGLSAKDLAHILATFPVLARKRPAFSAYLRQRLAEWMEETR